MGRIGIRVLAAVASLAAVTSCVAPPLESPSPASAEEVVVRVEDRVVNKVDILFMVDNSQSMGAMQEELKTRFNQFFKVFQDLSDRGSYADLHIGVVTSDYGAGGAGSVCSPSPGGQRGRLQALGQNAAPTCKPPVGANYISYDFDPAAKSHNLPAGQDLVKTFTCMASVGAKGCGFEHQLESVYAALHNNLPENHGFLRPDALLAVVFLTNEDDSSAPPDVPIFDANHSDLYGFLSTYRQTRYGIVCDYAGQHGVLPPYGDSAGPMQNCRPAPMPPGQEYDVQRYIDFFAKPLGKGGVKAHPDDVILVGIDAPESPVQIILADPASGITYTTCGALSDVKAPLCVPFLQHSCQNVASPEFFGDPPVRLDAVIRAARHHAFASICDADYSGALLDVAHLIVTSIGRGCIGGHLADPAHPDCVVEDVVEHDNGTATRSVVKSCAVAAPDAPCWKVEAKPECNGPREGGFGITIDRRGGKPPAGSHTDARCAVLPS